MTAIAWDAAGQRLFENGIDQVVLFTQGNIGVPWSGITSFDEAPSGGDANPFYLDAVKYVNRSLGEDFAATIEAFAAPAEFAPCDGRSQLATGLFATQQPRQQFSMCYRTLLGSDISPELGYKLHFLYNATAAPSGRSYSSINDTPSPLALSWSISTVPIAMGNGIKPGAHLFLDSTLISSENMAAVEAFVYGATGTDPAMPQPSDLVTLLS